jgi:hypothetical protein
MRIFQILKEEVYHRRDGSEPENWKAADELSPSSKLA